MLWIGGFFFRGVGMIGVWVRTLDRRKSIGPRFLVLFFSSFRPLLLLFSSSSSLVLFSSSCPLLFLFSSSSSLLFVLFSSSPLYQPFSLSSPRSDFQFAILECPTTSWSHELAFSIIPFRCLSFAHLTVIFFSVISVTTMNGNNIIRALYSKNGSQTFSTGSSQRNDCIFISHFSCRCRSLFVLTHVCLL